MFRDKLIRYSEENPVLDRYLEPAIDVGLEMTSKIMKENGDIVYWSTYCGLEDDEWKNQAHIYLRKEFDSNIKDRFGPDVYPHGFSDKKLEDTPL